MQLLVVVGDLEERGQVGAQSVQIAPVAALHLFLFECFHESLCFSVVVGIAHAAHARLHASFGQQREVVGASVLDAAVGVMNQTRRGLPLT